MAKYFYFVVTLFYFIFFLLDKLIQIVMTLEFLKYNNNIKLISMAQEHNAFLMAALEVIGGV